MEMEIERWREKWRERMRRVMIRDNEIREIWSESKVKEG